MQETPHTKYSHFNSTMTKRLWNKLLGQYDWNNVKEK